MVYEVKPIHPRWVRSKRGVLFGVCEGLGRSFNVEPWVLRLLWILSILMFGTGILLYIIAALTLPVEGELYQYDQRKILGVCLRIHHNTGIELGIIRMLMVLAALFSLFSSLGIVLFVYLTLYFFLPARNDKMYA